MSAYFPIATEGHGGPECREAIRSSPPARRKQDIAISTEHALPITFDRNTFLKGLGGAAIQPNEA
jgi:hypothetical protein